MRKLVFSALACVAFVGSSFAANYEYTKDDFCIFNMEEKVFDKPCTVSVSFITPEGKRGYEARNSITDEEGCNNALLTLISDLTEQGFEITNFHNYWGI